MKIQLKINGECAILPEGFSVKMVVNSPLFSEQGSFSFPFELDVNANSHIFKNVADSFGLVNLRDFHGMSAEIWYDGNRFFVGQTEIGSEQNLGGGKISLNVVGNNSAFKDMVNSLNCRDVKLKDKLKIGWRPSKVVWNPINREYTFTSFKDGVTKESAEYNQLSPSNALEKKTLDIAPHLKDSGTVFLPPILFNELSPNISEPYPLKAYCNVRMCCPNTKDENKQSEAQDNAGYGYKILEVDENNCAPSFYVLYFLDCLFAKDCLDINYDNSALFVDGDLGRPKYEDLCRLAFLNAYPRFDDDILNETYIPYSKLREYVGKDQCYYRVESHMHYNLSYKEIKHVQLGNTSQGIWHTYETNEVTDVIPDVDGHLNSSWYKYDCYANGENFPDVSVSNVISDLTNAFGIVFDYDQENNYMQLHLVKDIMNDNDVDMPQHIVLSRPVVVRNINKGQILSYGNNDDLNYNYRMPIGIDKYGKADPIVFDDYVSLSSSERMRTDYHTYYDRETCNAYRIRVDESTGLEPQFFEVGAYRDYKIGIVKDERFCDHRFFNTGNVYDPLNTTVVEDRDESSAEKTTINFKPVIINDVWSYIANKDKIVGVDVFDFPASSKDQDLCVWIDAEGFNNHNGVDVYNIVGNAESATPQGTIELLTSKAEMMSVNKVLEVNGVEVRINMGIDVTLSGSCAFNLSDEQHYLAKANVGYTLGFMRGPGNNANEDIVYNYDGEGNDSWVSTYDKPAFTADSVDLYGQAFDYNGTLTGGADMSKRLSLLLDARKVKEYSADGTPSYFESTNDVFARRGLVPQLLEEFLYFKSHCMTVKIPLLMSLTQIKSLNLLKWNMFGDYKGLIKSVSYELSDSGIKDIEVELNVLNS